MIAWTRAVADLVIDIDPEQFERFTEWVGDRDGMAYSSDGQIIATLFFDDVSECDKLHALLHDAVRELRVAGFDVVGLDFDLVNTTEIADRIGRTRQTVRQYADGLLGPGGFPAPLGVPGGVRVWDWGSVNEWLRGFDERGDPEYRPTREFIAEFNASVRLARCLRLGAHWAPRGPQAQAGYRHVIAWMRKAKYDYGITMQMIRQDHPAINRVLPGDVWTR